MSLPEIILLCYFHIALGVQFSNLIRFKNQPSVTTNNFLTISYRINYKIFRYKKMTYL
jgi:hypothetical protein